jgi:hypothetical protein
MDAVARQPTQNIKTCGLTLSASRITSCGYAALDNESARCKTGSKQCFVCLRIRIITAIAQDMDVIVGIAGPAHTR